MRKTKWEELPVDERGPAMAYGWDWDNLVPAARVARWEHCHGGQARAFQVGAWLLFPDGAMRENDPLTGVMREPPTDEWERLRLVVEYCEHHVRQARDAFIALKDQLAQRAKANVREQRFAAMPPSDEELARLGRLRGVAASWGVELAEARQRLADAKPEWLRLQESLAAQNQQQNEAFLAKLSNIQL